MGKIEKQVEEIHAMITKLSDEVSQLNFQFITLMQAVQSGTGDVSSSTVRREMISPTPAPDIDLTPLENRIDELIDRIVNNEALIEIRDEMKKLVEGKVIKAEETIKEVSNLLEKGLQLTELGTVLDEIRDKLDEQIVEMSSLIMQVKQPDNR